MPYIRHRPRMVRQSIYEDLRSLLVDLDWVPDDPNWKPGDPYDSSEFLGMISSPVVLTDYFPVSASYQGEDIEPNTLALDQGTPGDPQYVEMGGDDREQEYLFNLAFFAENDAVALSLFSDLADRYRGVTPGMFESVSLFDYLTDPSTPVVEMDVLSFEVAKSPEQPAPGRMLWFAQLVVSDYLELDE